MQHVGQRLDMHQAMLNRHVKQGVEWETVACLAVRFQTSVCQFPVQSGTDSRDIVAHSLKGRPVRRLVGRQSAPYRVDAECKQPVKFAMKTLQPQDVLVQQVPVKRFEMPNVKNDAVTLWNGPFVHRVSPHNVEERVTSPPSIGDPLQ